MPFATEVRPLCKGDAMNDYLKKWLKQRFFHDFYDVEGDPIAGTYGQVWIMQANRAVVDPPRFALKTLDPEKLGHKLHAEDLRNFERELALWLSLPSHLNVLPAFRVLL